MAAQKPPQQHLAGETSLLGGRGGGTWSPTTVAQVPVTSREMATVGWKFNEASTLDIELGQGPMTTKVQFTLGVTVVPAPSGKRQKVMRYWHHWYHDVPGRDFTVILTEALFKPPHRRRVEHQRHGFCALVAAPPKVVPKSSLL